MQKKIFGKFLFSLWLGLSLIQINTVLAFEKNNISDPITFNTYQSELMENTPSSKSSGKIWQDKSVIANSNHLTNNINVDSNNIPFEDDFLEVFSALGSSCEIGETTKAPIDLVIALDVSKSMTDPLDDNSLIDPNLGRQKTKLDEMVEALNSVFQKVTVANPENKVSLILFATHATTVIPLDHISQLNNKPFIEITKLIPEESGKVLNPTIDLKISYKDSGKEAVEKSYSNIRQKLSSQTNFEAVYYEGFKQFSDNKTGSETTNKPKLITLSDGVYTVCYQDFFDFGDKETFSEIDGDISTLSVATIINSIYFKTKANQNYHYPVEVINLLSSYSSKDNDRIKIEAITNKDNYLLSSVKLDNTSTLGKCQKVFQEWKDKVEKGTFKEEVELEDLRIPDLPKDISLDKFLENINLIDVVEEVPFTEQSKVLDDIVTSFLSSDFKPVDETLKNSLEGSGELTYHETIGDYMQVNLKQMILFSKSYGFKKLGSQVNRGITQETFIPVSSDGSVIKVKNNSYSNPVSFNLSDIRVVITTNPDGNQELKISIPSKALPILKTIVNYEQNYDQDFNRNIKSVYDNRDSNDSLPIRFIYGVNLRPELVNDDNTINLDEIDPDYLEKHRNGDTVEFFTTKYEDRENNTKYAQSNFIPSLDNSYYIAQDDYPIYSDYNSTSNTVGNALNSKSQLNGASTYYLEKPYYYSTGSQYLKDKNIDSLKGKDLIDNASNLAEEGNKLILKKGNNYIGSLGNYQIYKTDNLTNTSDLRVLPNIDTTQVRPEVVNYLGNNGKCALTVREIKLLITKYHSIGENLLTKDSLTVNAGSIITYSLEVSNGTSTDVNNVTVSDAVPTGLQLINDSITDGGTVSNGTIYWTINVPANSTVTLKFQALVVDNSIQTYENNFTIQYENEHGTYSETSNTVVENLVYPDLDIEKYQAEEGQIPSMKEISYMKGGDKLIEYQFKVTNHGTGPANDVNVYDDVPADFEIQNSTISDNGTAVNNRVSWTIDHLDPGESKVVGFKVVIPEETAAKSWINTSYVNHSTDPNPKKSNDVLVEKNAGNISIRKTQATNKNPNPTYDNLLVAPEDIITYYIKVSNNADLPEENITVTDPIPNGLDVNQDSISDGGTLSEGAVKWIIPLLNARQSITLSFSVTVPAGQQTNIWKNTAQLDQDGLPTTYSNTVISEEQEIIETINLSNQTPDSKLNTSTFERSTPNNPAESSITNNNLSNINEVIKENGINPQTGLHNRNSFLSLVFVGALMFLSYSLFKKHIS